VTDELTPQTPPVETPQADARNAVDPTERRFLFIDIASQRAKQLRRGALNRLPVVALPEGAPPAPVRKAERIAMDEVKRGYVKYENPVPKPPSNRREEV
jgi:DNA-directed RNA polymerase subunit K/omega